MYRHYKTAIARFVTGNPSVAKRTAGSGLPFLPLRFYHAKHCLNVTNGVAYYRNLILLWTGFRRNDSNLLYKG